MTTTIALTTIFTPPADCSSSWTYEAATYNGVESGLLLQNAIQSSMDASCFPPGFNHAGRGTGAPVFSPGMCPHGYTTNHPATTVESNTIASCCLKGYYFLTSGGMQGCISTHTGKTFVAARAGGFTTATDYTTSTTASGTIQMWGQPITIMYQASDQSLYTTSTSKSATSTSSSSTTSSATSSAASSNTLSGGAKAGIAIGSVVGALLLLGVGLFFWRSYRKKRRLEEGGTQGAMQAHELDYNMAMRPVPIPIELENRSVGSQFGGKPILGHTRTPELE